MGDRPRDWRKEQTARNGQHIGYSRPVLVRSQLAPGPGTGERSSQTGGVFGGPAILGWQRAHSTSTTQHPSHHAAPGLPAVSPLPSHLHLMQRGVCLRAQAKLGHAPQGGDKAGRLQLGAGREGRQIPREVSATSPEGQHCLIAGNNSGLGQPRRHAPNCRSRCSPCGHMALEHPSPSRQLARQ